ncbi:M48 family metallopeptidase [Merismopedia glauca]|uniref:Peptidase n=1 Tax=Merismopedia glauca CCAP 1448/3 TaxID=1296344 RepID=A0A2T1C2U0_9CYAN|nr:M48 family metallopeptidase [Merismopedia glauca]PSB02524.1 peptidase [Merismopedia glauca CCAP 1448/3]
MKFHLRTKVRRWFYPLLSLLVMWGVIVGTPQISQAIPLRQLLPGAVQFLQFSSISDKQEIQLGGQINKQLVNGDVRLYRNSELNRYINGIGQRLARKSDRPNLDYTFQVVDDSAINAFATMGGYVYIHTGTIAAADNEAQLASVIAHEIGHIGGRHSIKQMKQALLAQGVTQILGVDSNKAVQIGVELALKRPHSRRDEYDADVRGLKTLKRTGYAPSGMVGFMKKLLNSGGGTPTFLSTHPGTQDRIEALQENISSTEANRGSGLDNAAYKSRIRSFINS